MKNHHSVAPHKSKPLKSKPREKPKGKKAKLGSAPNMQAAATRTGYPFEMLSEAKNAGCSAFTLRGSVDCDAFVDWLESKDQVGFLKKWNDQGAIPSRDVSKRIREHYDAMEAKRRFEEKSRKLISREFFAEVVGRVCSRQRAILEKHVTPETLAEICIQMQPLFDECAEK